MRSVKARYTQQTNPRMQGNPMIEALPPLVPDSHIAQSLALVPHFDLVQRQWSDQDRIQEILALSNFMYPLGLHIELSGAIQTTIREGYVGRCPANKTHVEALGELYKAQKNGGIYSQRHSVRMTSECGALLGVSGMGKTVTLKRWLSIYPPVIEHEELDILQLPYIYIEMSSAGSSVKALAYAIILQIDALLPQFGYADLYLGTRQTGEMLLQTVGRLMAIHYVGMLVVDETQNLNNSPSGAARVMTELTTLCNILNVPILFVGTPAAMKVLGRDFRIARRATGLALSKWERLPLYDDAGPDNLSEWAEFTMALSKYQWVKQPLEFDSEVLRIIYGYTQGILALTIKLFQFAQIRAISAGADELTLEWFDHVYEVDFKILHEVIGALSVNDTRILGRYSDAAPFADQVRLEQLSRSAKQHPPKAEALNPSPQEPGQADEPPPPAASIRPKSFPGAKPPATGYLEAYELAVKSKRPILKEFERMGFVANAEAVIPVD